MSIINIRHTWLRRGVLVLAFLPLLAVGVLVYSAKTAFDVVVDSFEAAAGAWRGRR